MKNKQIVFTAPNTVELIESEFNDIINENEVVVRLCYSTISSGTERANLMGNDSVSIHTTAEIPFPRYCGYSSSGIVEKIGKNVNSVAVGDAVAVSWSTHSKYVITQENNIHKIEFEDISLQEAALMHIATFPMLGIRKCRLEIGESAIVVGLGVLGIIAIKLLKAAGAYPIIAADIDPAKLDQALEIGADYAFNSADSDFADNVKRVTNGGVNVAIEVTGIGKALDSTLDCCAKFARVALLGCTRNSDFTIDYYHKVHGPGVSLIGANTNSRPEFESSVGAWTTHDDAMAMLNMIHGKRFEFKDLIEEVHSPADAVAVYDRLVKEKAFPIVQFDWSGI